MTVFALHHDALFRQLVVTTHPHAEAARQFAVQPPATEALVVIGMEDLAGLTSPKLAVLFNRLTDDETKHVGKFETKGKGQARVFLALSKKYGSQEQEPFNPVEEPAGSKVNNSGADHKEDSSEGSNLTEEATMATKTKKTAKKTKAKKAPAERKPRVAAALTVDLPSNLKPGADVKCGTYIRSLVMLGKTTEDILAKVKSHYPDSAAKASDVSWNRGKLKAAGKKLPKAD